MKLDKQVVDMFTELTKPADDVKMEKTCYGTISVVDGTRYVKLDGSDLLVPAASTVKTSHGDRVTVLMKNHSLTVTGNLTAPATDGEGGSSGEAGTAATIEIGTVTTGEAGSSASVTNSGTNSAAVFDFVIPKGDKGDKGEKGDTGLQGPQGEKGDTGPQGPQGEKGDTGTWDGTIPDHEHTVSDITDFPTSLPANGGDADTLDGKHYYDFVNYLGNITDVGNILNNPEYGDCPYEGVISSDVATSIGLSSAVATEWSIKCFRATEGSGFQIAVPLYCGGEYPKYRVAVKNHLGGSSYILAWGNWKNFSDGGNADTVDGLHANEIASDPNLLINPDFKINQRGKTEYSASGYTVDRWQISNNARLTPHDGYITFESTVDKATPPLFQKIENPTALSGKTVTLSFDCDLKTEGAWISVQAVTNGSWNPSVPVPLTDTGRSVKSTIINLPDNLTDLRVALIIHSTDSAPLATVDIYGAKLELGEIATPIVPADPATELAKCQRYYVEFNPYNCAYCNVGVGTGWTNNRAAIYLTTPVPMRGLDTKVPTLSVSGSWAVTNNNVPANDIPVSISTAMYKSNISANRLLVVCEGTGISAGQTYSLRVANDTTAKLSLSAEL